MKKISFKMAKFIKRIAAATLALALCFSIANFTVNAEAEKSNKEFKYSYSIETISDEDYESLVVTIVERINDEIDEDELTFEDDLGASLDSALSVYFIMEKDDKLFLEDFKSYSQEDLKLIKLIVNEAEKYSCEENLGDNFGFFSFDIWRNSKLSETSTFVLSEETSKQLTCSYVIDTISKEDYEILIYKIVKKINADIDKDKLTLEDNEGLSLGTALTDFFDANKDELLLQGRNGRYYSEEDLSLFRLITSKAKKYNCEENIKENTELFSHDIWINSKLGGVIIEEPTPEPTKEPVSESIEMIYSYKISDLSDDEYKEMVDKIVERINNEIDMEKVTINNFNKFVVGIVETIAELVELDDFEIKHLFSEEDLKLFTIAAELYHEYIKNFNGFTEWNYDDSFCEDIFHNIGLDVE